MRKEHYSESEKSWVLASLEPDQLVKAKRQPLPRRVLRRGELFIMWALRLYLIFMMFVVAYQVSLAAR